MGCRELIDSLRSMTGEKIRAIQRESEQEADTIRAETAAALAQLRTEAGEKHSAAATQKIAQAVAEAGVRARAQRLAAEHELAQKLFLLGVSSLQRLRTMEYAATFARMAHELPELAWKIVRVNSGDGDLARTHFPEAKIIFDDDIAGGMDVMIEGERIRVINTLNKRLERAWQDLLPDLMADVRKEASDAATSSNH